MSNSSRTRLLAAITGALLLATFAVLAAGFARPAAPHRIPRERATILLAIDTSNSMEATDVGSSRMKAAQAAASAFVDLVPRTIDVGLVLFNRRATLEVPPTTSHGRVKEALAYLRMGESTAIGEAIYASLQAIAAVPPDGSNAAPPAHIVLLSDGKTQIGRSNESATQAALAAGVPVTTIAFGTDEGYVVTPNEPDKRFPVPVDRDALKVIADTTKGAYFEAASEPALRRAYENIATTVGYSTVDQQDSPAAFVRATLVLLLATSAVSMAAILSWHRSRQPASEVT